jgi:hypothetical protein
VLAGTVTGEQALGQRVTLASYVVKGAGRAPTPRPGAQTRDPAQKTKVALKVVLAAGE